MVCFERFEVKIGKNCLPGTEKIVVQQKNDTFLVF